MQIMWKLFLDWIRSLFAGLISSTPNKEIDVNKDTIQTIVDGLFLVLEKHFAGYPFFLFALEGIQRIADMLIDLLVVEVAKKAAASPVGSNPTVKDVIDALFDLLQAKLVTRPILVMVLEALQQVVGLIID